MVKLKFSASWRFLKVPEGPWRFLKGPDGSWRFLKVLEGYWILKVPEGSDLNLFESFVLSSSQELPVLVKENLDFPMRCLYFIISFLGPSKHTNYVGHFGDKDWLATMQRFSVQQVINSTSESLADLLVWKTMSLHWAPNLSTSKLFVEKFGAVWKDRMALL